MILELRASDLGPRFRQPGGAEFTEFCTRVIRGACSTLNIPQSAIDVCSRTDAADGGVDVAVKQGNPGDPTGYFRVPSVWQFKARPNDGLSADDVNTEFKPRKDGKPKYLHQLVGQGFGYRFCVADAIPAPKKQVLKDAAEKQVRDLGIAEPDVAILTLDDPVQLANRFPAIVLGYIGAPAGWQTFDAWQRNVTEATPKFVAPASFPAACEMVLHHARLAERCPSAVLRIQGAAGVGKTRAVFEALRTMPNAASCVVYTDSEERAAELCVHLTNHPEASCLLVADECSLDKRAQINNTLSGCKRRVRCICIDNGREHLANAAPELDMNKFSDAELARVLDANFASVPQDRRLRYADLAGGFVRVAVDMCRFDSQISTAGSLKPAMESIESYFCVRLQTEQERRAVATIALLKRVRHKRDGEAPSEVGLLCGLTGEAEKTVREILDKIKDSPGFVERGALYYRISAEPIAMVAFDLAWRTWAASDPAHFLNRIPPELSQSFMDRVAESAVPEVRATVQDFFLHFVDHFAAESLKDPNEARKLVTLVESSPDLYLPRLAEIVQGATPEQLGVGTKHAWPGSDPSRRQLVWLAENLARFPEFFDGAEAILWHLAHAETEPKIGNNSSHTWQNLFRMTGSGTAQPLAMRLDTLRKRIDSTTAADAELLGGALDEMLEFQGVRILGPLVVAGRLPPAEWKPTSAAEASESLRAALSLIGEARRHPVPAVAARCSQTFVRAVEEMIRQGFAREVQAVFSLSDESEQLRAEVARTMTAWLRLARKSGDHFPPGYIDRVEAWLGELRPMSLGGRVQEKVGSKAWDHWDEEAAWTKELDNLAAELIQNPSLLDELLPWLSGPEALSSSAFGSSLAVADHCGLLLDRIVETACRTRNVGLARGYFNGMVYRVGANIAELASVLDRLEAAEPLYSFHLALAGGQALDSFGRSLRLVRAQRIDASQLQNFTVWNGTERTTNAEASEAIQALLPIAESGDAEASGAIFDFFGARISAGTFDAWAASESDLICHTLEVVRPSRQAAFWWAKTLEALAESHPELVVKLATREMVLGDFDVQRAADSAFAQMSARVPDLAMAEVGSFVLSEEYGWHFFTRKFNVFTALPAEVVSAWLKENGVAAARKIARHVPKPCIDSQGNPVVPPLTEFLLENFADDEETFREFCAGIHDFQMYSGDIAAEHEREVGAARAFMNHRLRRVREWAAIEMHAGAEAAQRFRESLDETAP